MKLIDEIIQELEEALRLRREDFVEDNFPRKKIEIQILGQMSLMMNKEISSQINLVRTNDVDAFLNGEWGQAKIFRDVLKSKGLEFDELSEEVWLPEDSQFIEYYDSPYVKLSYLDPISALTSKAIKAKEKNKGLVTDALKIYGDRLAAKITAHGGDISYFGVAKKLKL